VTDQVETKKRSQWRKEMSRAKRKEMLKISRALAQEKFHRRVRSMQEEDFELWKASKGHWEVEQIEGREGNAEDNRLRRAVALIGSDEVRVIGRRREWK
jgi:hypothetical protein